MYALDLFFFNGRFAGWKIGIYFLYRYDLFVVVLQLSVERRDISRGALKRRINSIRVKTQHSTTTR